MEALQSFLQMGGYAGFVWPAYGLSMLVLCGLFASSLHKMRASERQLSDLRAAGGGDDV